MRASVANKWVLSFWKKVLDTTVGRVFKEQCTSSIPSDTGKRGEKHILMTEAKRDSEELNAEEVSRMSQIGCLFSFLCIRGIHDKNVFNSQRAFSINTEVLSVTMSNQNFICVTFFFSGCKTAECLTVSGTLDVVSTVLTCWWTLLEV